MNRYHIEVIGSANPFVQIEADYVDYSQVGFFVFKKVISDNELIDVAFFPVYKTSIRKIEYDIENKN